MRDKDFHEYAYYPKPKRRPLKHSVKRGIYTAIGAMLTTNILSTICGAALRRYTDMSGTSTFLGVLATLSAFIALVLVCIVSREEDTADDADKHSPCTSVLGGIVLALVIFFFTFARLGMLYQRMGVL